MGRGKYRVHFLCHLDWKLLGLMVFISLNFLGGLHFNFFLIPFFMAYYEAITVFYWHSHIDTWVTHAKIHLFMEFQNKNIPYKVNNVGKRSVNAVKLIISLYSCRCSKLKSKEVYNMVQGNR